MTQAHLITKDTNGRPLYGGTTHDESVIRYIDYLRNEGYKIMFYPMLLIDLLDKPWRGHIFSSSAEEVYNFFHGNHGYNKFVLHYASILKRKIDAFVIVSELKKFTQTVNDKYTTSDPKRYPVVLELINLAKMVKEILGNNSIITYAADWSGQI